MDARTRLILASVIGSAVVVAAYLTGGIEAATAALKAILQVFSLGAV